MKSMFTRPNLARTDENAAEGAKGNATAYGSQTLHKPCFDFLKFLSVVFFAGVSESIYLLRLFFPELH